jgi:hypothetical protein
MLSNYRARYTFPPPVQRARRLGPPLPGLRRAFVVAIYSRLPKLVVQYCCSLREGNLLRRSVLGSAALRKTTCGLFRGGRASIKPHKVVSQHNFT